MALVQGWQPIRLPPLGVPTDLQSVVKKCPNLFILRICNPLYPNRLTPNPSSRNAAASRILMIKFFISQSYFIISEKRNSSFSDAVRIRDAPAIPTTIFRLGYPRLA